MENKDITNIKLLITVGILITLFLAVAIILFVVYYQRKMLLKEAKIKLMEQEKQIALFKVTVEAEEQQKEKIARNLHDEINPLLAVLKFNLSKHRIESRKNKFDPDSLIADSELLDKAIEGIRTTCLELIPTFLLQYGLIKSIEDYINKVQQSGNITIEFENKLQSNELDNFEKQNELNAYRICLEILNNLFKHTHCSYLKITTECFNNIFRITFLHNGKGFTNDEMQFFTENSNGLGLKSLKARTLILNATIDYSKDTTTSTVKLSIPYQHG